MTNIAERHCVACEAGTPPLSIERAKEMAVQVPGWTLHEEATGEAPTVPRLERAFRLKNFAAVCINGVGAATFIVYQRVDWPLALSMMVMAVAGGYGGAGLARRVGQANVRRFVVAIGLIFGAYTLYGQLHHG